MTKDDDSRAEEDPRFKKVVGNLLRTPPKPHKDEPSKRKKGDGDERGPYS